MNIIIQYPMLVSIGVLILGGIVIIRVLVYEKKAQKLYNNNTGKFGYGRQRFK